MNGNNPYLALLASTAFALARTYLPPGFNDPGTLTYFWTRAMDYAMLLQSILTDSSRTTL